MCSKCWSMSKGGNEAAEESGEQVTDRIRSV